jgi:hypothetical protein
MIALFLLLIIALDQAYTIYKIVEEEVALEKEGTKVGLKLLLKISPEKTSVYKGMA